MFLNPLECVDLKSNSAEPCTALQKHSAGCRIFISKHPMCMKKVEMAGLTGDLVALAAAERHAGGKWEISCTRDTGLVE